MIGGAARAAHAELVRRAREQVEHDRAAHTAAIAASAEEYARQHGLVNNDPGAAGQLSRAPSTAELVADDIWRGGDGMNGLKLAQQQYLGNIGVVYGDGSTTEAAWRSAERVVRTHYATLHGVPGTGPMPENRLPEPKRSAPLVRRPPLCRCGSVLKDGRCEDPECGAV